VISWPRWPARVWAWIGAAIIGIFALAELFRLHRTTDAEHRARQAAERDRTATATTATKIDDAASAQAAATAEIHADHAEAVAVVAAERETIAAIPPNGAAAQWNSTKWDD
jgi:hypothetical protein